MASFQQAVRQQRLQEARTRLSRAQGMGNPDALAQAADMGTLYTGGLKSPESMIQPVQNEQLVQNFAADAPLTGQWMDQAPENAGIVADDIPQLIDWERTLMRNLDSREAGNVVRGWQNVKLAFRNIAPSFMLTERTATSARATANLNNLTAIAEATAAGEEIDFEQLDLPSGGHERRNAIARLQRFATATPEERQRVLTEATQTALEDRAAAQEYLATIQSLAAERARVNFTATQDIRDIRSFDDLLEWGTVQGMTGIATIAAIVGAGVFTGGVGAVATGLTLGGGLATGEIVSGQVEGLTDATMYTPEEVLRARRGAALSGAVELVLGPASRVTGLAARTMFSRAARREALDNISEPVLRRVSQGYLRRLGAPFLRDGIEEFIAEGAQTLIEQASIEGELRLDNETLWAAFNGAALGGLTGGAFGMGVGARTSIRAERVSRQLRDAGQTVQTMEELEAVTKQLKLAQRSTRKLEQLANALGLNNSTVFFQAEAIRDHAERSGQDPVAMVESMGGSASDYESALTHNGRIAVKASGVVKDLVGDRAEFIKKNGSMTPQGYSPREADQFETTRQEIEDQVALQNDLEGMAPQRRQIFESVKQQLQAAGRSEREAETNATLATAFFETMATRYGDSAQAMYERFGFDVVGEGQQLEAQARVQEQAQQELDRQTELRTQLQEVVRAAEEELAGLEGEALAAAEAALQDAVDQLDAAGVRIDELSAAIEGGATFNQIGRAQQLLREDPEALGLTEQLTARVNPIYAPERLPAERLPSNMEAALWIEREFAGDERIIQSTQELTPEQTEEIASIMAAEAQLALENTGNAFDWYSGAMERMLDVVKVKYPMLADDAAAAEAGFGTAANANFVFTYIMAVTSQNLDVAANSVATDRAFSEFIDQLADGNYTMPRRWGTGDKQEAMGDNFDKFAPLIDAMEGEDFPTKLAQLDVLFREEKTVKEWVADMKAEGIPYSAPGQTAADAVVYGSSLLGPKIGNGFWQNLNGNFSPLTIDLWMRRTWGRMVGSSIGNPAALPDQRARMKAAVERSMQTAGDQDMLADLDAELANLQQQLADAEEREYPTKKAKNETTKALRAQINDIKEIAADARGVQVPEDWDASYDTDDLALLGYAKRVLRVWDKEYNRLRGEYRKVPAELQPTWARAAKTIITNLSKPLDQVQNATQRKQIENAGARAQQMLTERGIDLTMADLQAILWYPEKELWGALTSELEVDQDNVPIVPPNPLNESYDMTFARILEAQGYGAEEIADASGLDAGELGSGAVAGQDGGPEGQAGAAGAGQVGGESGGQTLNQSVAQRFFRGSTEVETEWAPNIHEAGRAYYYTTERATAEQYGDIIQEVEVEGRILDEESAPDPDVIFELVDTLEGLGHTAGRFRDPSTTGIALQDIARGIDGDFEQQQAALNEALSEMGYVARQYTEENGARSIAVWEEAVVRRLPADQTLLQTRDSGVRGQIFFSNSRVMSGGRSVITLFQSADRSTFAHEAGHFFLQAFTELAGRAEAPADMQNDLVTINKFLGRDENDMSADFTVEQQEQWAQAFEKYVETGKAPSVALRRSFERLRKWLVNVYRQFGGLNVELPDEISEVMDRMLATDDAIAIAKAEQDMSPMFTQRPPEMSESDWAAYKQLATEHDDEAHATLIEKTMSAIRARRSAGYQERRDALRAEVAEAVDQEPIYRLIRQLQAKDQPRLNRAQLVDEFGEDVVTQLDKHSGKRKIYGREGGSNDGVAHTLGYRNAATLVDELVEAPSREEKIESELRMRLREEFADVLDDGSIREEAMAALHGDKNRQVMHRDLQMIREQIIAAGGEPPTMRTVKQLKEDTLDDVADTSVRQASQAGLFLRAERVAARKAQTKLGRVVRRAAGRDLRASTGLQDLMEAYAAKEQQLIAHYKYVEARKVQQQVAQMQRKAKEINRREAGKRIAEPHLSALRDLLEKYDLRKRSRRQIRETVSLAAYARKMQADGRENEVAFDVEGAIAEGARKHYTDLTVDELQELQQIVKNIEHIGRTKKKILEGIKQRDFKLFKADAIAQLEENFKDADVPLAPSNEGFFEKGGRAVRGLLLSSSNIDGIMQVLDRGRAATVGLMNSALVVPVQDAMNRAMKRRRDNADFIGKELWQTAFGSDYMRKLNELKRMKVKVNMRDGKATLDGTQLIALMANTGNADNMERLTNANSPNGMTKQEIERVAREHMTPELWKVVTTIWAKLEETWPEIEALEVRTTGVKPNKIETRIQIDNAPASASGGGYYPIRYDPRLNPSTVGDADINQQVQNMATGRFARAQTRNGHTKERASATGDPILLDLGILQGHMNDVAYDLELREPLSSSMKIIKDRDIGAVFGRKGLHMEREQIQMWLEDIANGDRWSSDAVLGIVRRLREGVSVAAMGFSWTTLVQQPLGLFNAANVIGSVNLLKGYSSYLSNPANTTQLAKELSPFMEERVTTLQRDIALATGAMREGGPQGRAAAFKDQFTALAFYFMSKLQFYGVDLPTWNAAFGIAKQRGDTDQEATSYADRIVARSQGSGVLSDRSAFERGTTGQQSRQSEWARAFTTFMTFVLARLSVTQSRWRNFVANPDDLQTVFDLAGDIMLGYILPSIMTQLVLLTPWDEREQDEIEELGMPLWWAKNFAMREVVGGVPLVSQVGSAWQGYGATSAFGAGLEDVATGAAALPKAMSDFLTGDDPNWQQVIESTVTGVGVAFKFPSVVINRVVGEVFEDDALSRDEWSLLQMLYGKELTFVD